MDVQIQTTPPKRNRQHLDPCTPPKGSTPMDYFNTPSKKKTPSRTNQDNIGNDRTPIKSDNPQSKRLGNLGATNRKLPKTPSSSNRKVAEFNVSRLEQDYIFEKKLGEGNFSSVGLYRSRMTDDLFAIKTTKLSAMSVNEAQALGTLSILSQKSKNIIRYYHSWVQNLQFFIVMELCSHNLAQVYRRHRFQSKPIQETYIKDVLKQVLQGLKCMHENQIVHLDIKPDNILFKDTIIKISDLGLARITKIKREGDLEEGDSRYVAKEMLNYYQGMDLTKADIFSLALSIYEGITQEILPKYGDKWLEMRENGLHLKDRMDLQDYSQELLEILEMMTRPIPNQRPSAAQILRMAYFKESLTRKSRILMQNHFGNKNEKKRRQGSV